MNISVHLHHVPRPVASLTNVWQVTRPLSDRWRSRFFLEVRQSHQQLGIFCFCLWPPHVKSYVACDASTQFLLRSNNLRIENESSVKPQKMFHKICGFFKVSTFFLIQTKTLEGCPVTVYLQVRVRVRGRGGTTIVRKQMTCALAEFWFDLLNLSNSISNHTFSSDYTLILTALVTLTSSRFSHDFIPSYYLCQEYCVFTHVHLLVGLSSRITQKLLDGGWISAQNRPH